MGGGVLGRGCNGREVQCEGALWGQVVSRDMQPSRIHAS